MDEFYFLQNCNAGYVGNSPVFWAKSGGYTQWIDEAKRWTRDEANKQIESTRGSHQWELWLCGDVVSASKRTVDIQDLRKVRNESHGRS